MVNYTCDICGEDATSGSVQHVDRYQLQLDLCGEHLSAWISYCKVLLATPYANVQNVNHTLSRAFMDAIYLAEGSQTAKDDNGNDIPAKTPQEAVAMLHFYVEDFKAKNGAAAPQPPKPSLTIAK